VNFKITGGGFETIMGGVSAETFYAPSDPGVSFNLYTTFTSYTIPGLAVM
jgi:cellulase